MEESRVDVKTGNDDEESLEVGILTFEVIQQTFTNGEGQELEDCGHVDYRSWCVVYVKDHCAGKHLPVEPSERGRERTKISLLFFLCVSFMQENADTTLKHEIEPSPEVFQEVTIYSCVEVVVRIKPRQQHSQFR